jgi:hypothetical protein
VATIIWGVGRSLEPRLKEQLVRGANSRLVGYTVQVESVSVYPWNLELVLHNVALRQDRHPEPDVVRIPRMDIGLQWLPLLQGRMVATSHLDSPIVNINVAQLEAELQGEIDFRERGWQRLLELYPLEVNEVSVRNASLTYTAAEAERPLRLRQASLEIHNIRKVTNRDQRYPSPLRASAVVFDEGQASFSGNADFVRFTRPAFRGNLAVDGVPLETLGPILKNYPLKVQGGVLSAVGEVQADVGATRAHLSQVRITDIRVDYLGGSDPAVVEAGRRVVQAAVRTTRDPTVQLELDDLRVTGEFAYVNLGRRPGYRVFLHGSTLVVQHAANHAALESTVALTGQLMGSGHTTVRGVFRTGSGKPDFALVARVTNADLTQLNDMLRAHLNLDVARGQLSVYSEMVVHDGQIQGYVKPLFEDVKVYGAQDADDNAFHRLYEHIADGVRKILESHQKHSVATVANLSGSVSDPNTSVLQVIGNLLRNAFIEAILPGFERRYGHSARAPPPPNGNTGPTLRVPSADALPASPTVRGDTAAKAAK